MKITRLVEAPNVPFALDGKVMLKSDELEIIHLRLNPGQKLEKNRNPFDTVFYILEGKAIIDTQKGAVVAEPDMVIELSKIVERSVENNNSTDFRMLVIRKLKTADK
jgi:mannose-6-phosphate isomerase-like protein (cupin superfamily)